MSIIRNAIQCKKCGDVFVNTNGQKMACVPTKLTPKKGSECDKLRQTQQTDIYRKTPENSRFPVFCS